MNLTPELRLAIETGIKDALKKVAKTAGDARDGAPSDVTMKDIVIDMRLALTEMNIGHDTDKAPTASIPLLPCLALMVKRMGATREAALQTLKEVMEQALALDKDASESLLKEAGVAEAEELVVNRVISQLPRTKVKKSVTVKGAELTVNSIKMNN